MWKTVLAGTTALAIAGATLAYAQPGPAGHERGQRWRPNAADIAAFADARIAALHAGLQLNARAGEELAGGGRRVEGYRQAARRPVRCARQRRQAEDADRAAGRGGRRR